MVIWAAISWYSAGPIITLNGLINTSDYVDILVKRMHSMVQKYRNNDANFQDDNSPIHQSEEFSLSFRSLKMNFSIFPFYFKYQATVYL